jgi:hypothetical protein
MVHVHVHVLARGLFVGGNPGQKQQCVHSFNRQTLGFVKPVDLNVEIKARGLHLRVLFCLAFQHCKHITCSAGRFSTGRQGHAAAVLRTRPRGTRSAAELRQHPFLGGCTGNGLALATLMTAPVM